MKDYLIKILATIALLPVFQGCIDPFSPPETNLPDRYLVFDGFLNTNGTDTSWVHLSRTQNVHTYENPTVETLASVKAEGDKGSVLVFNEVRQGSYFLPPRPFDQTEKFRLKIRLSNGRSYTSDLVPIVKSPPIDSISYTVNGRDGIQIYANTHDPADATRFYRWHFDETWEYRTLLYSLFEVVEVNGVPDIVPRTNDISTCWTSQKSSQINIFTTVKLSKDIVKMHPITYVDANTGKLLVKYSIKVTQNALTREAYDYWNELSKTTETTGSIFDPFPSQVTGNITSEADPREPVFGFFSAGESQSKRIFIQHFMGTRPYCTISDTLSRKEVFESSDLVLSEVELPIGLRYLMGTTSCVDCRHYGGDNRRPPFWE